ncbi:MAG: pyridoxal-phosphate dependent enzyme [Chitinophagaceae bacterium]|nr:MAG: pyridoxal-phosphate dependent enzyme [Chitinophagaceae bacterium]
MHSGNEIFLQPFAPVPAIHTLPATFVPGTNTSVLRLDKIDAVVSGNKWYKLRYYLDEAIATGKGILTWGGAWSNHIIATAAACRRLGIPCAGIIRGEEPEWPSATLKSAARAGMSLYYVSRSDYAAKKTPVALSTGNFIHVPEGGAGETGARGAATILRDAEATDFTHIFCAVGTGTTLAGLVRGAAPGQQVIGIAVLKDYSLENTIRSLLQGQDNWQLLHGYERGGYAKHDRELIGFMNEFFDQANIRTDFVYTAKMFMAAQALLRATPLPEQSRVLLIHSGGLQGNRGLPIGTRLFGL